VIPQPSTWGRQKLRPGDKVCEQNSDLWWLVLANTKGKIILGYASPAHRRSGMHQTVGIVNSRNSFYYAWRVKRRGSDTFEEQIV
jgi:hypothetical protein